MIDLHEKDKLCEPKNIFILMHGTWARNASWCNEGSKLREYLQSKYGKNGVCDIFNWSGKNNPFARHEAAGKLIDHIKKNREINSNAKIHLIAHSHAGNIVLYAVNNNNIENEISSLVCLSTPFLHTNKRMWNNEDKKKLKSIHGSLKILFLITLIIVFILSIIIIFGLGYLGLFLKIPEFDMFDSEFISVFHPNWVNHVFDKVNSLSADISGDKKIVSVVGFFILIYLILGKGIQSIKYRFIEMTKLFEKLSLPKSVNFKVMIIRGAADEASSALRFSQLISSLFTKFLSGYLYLVSNKGEKKQQIAGKIFFGISTILLIFLMFYDFSIKQDNVISQDYIALSSFATFGITLWLLPFILYLFALPIFVMLATLIGIAQTPFGWQFLINTIGLQISAETTPPGDWIVTHLTPNGKEGNDLRHSTHSNTDAFKKMSSFYEDNGILSSSQADPTNL